MKANLIFLVLIVLFATASNARADAYAINNNPCVIKKVVVFNRITCGSYYETTFYCEHYLSPGQWMDLRNGYESGECWHSYTISSTANIPLVTVSASGGSPIRTGIGSPSGPSKSVTLTIGGSGSMNDVAVGSSNTGRFQVSELSRNGANRTIFVQVTGVSATPTGFPSGDAYINIIYKDNVCAQIAVVVVKPTSSVHSAGNRWWVNSHNSGTLFSGTYQIVSLAIKDQFGYALDPIFAAAVKVDERFDNQSGSSEVTMGSIRDPIRLPNGHLYTSGIIDDQCGMEFSYSTFNMNASQEAAWIAGTLNVQLPNGDSGRNLLQCRYKGVTHQRQGTMIIWVWGTQLTNTLTRQITITSGHPAVCTVADY